MPPSTGGSVSARRVNSSRVKPGATVPDRARSVHHDPWPSRPLPLNPALARLNDGRVIVYGTMGGDGQPQTQSAVFTRYAVFGQGMQQAISAPRWLLGRTWGQASDTLKLEARFDSALVAELKRRGHDVEVLQAYDETMGHAGGIARHADGTLEAGFDPRSDGAAAGF